MLPQCPSRHRQIPCTEAGLRSSAGDPYSSSLACIRRRECCYGQAKRTGIAYQPEILPNGDSVKQLLARSRYLSFKHPGAWTREQRQRAELLFTRYPVIHKGYQLSLRLGEVFRYCTSKEQAFKKLALWFNDVEDAGLPSFKTLARTIQHHYLSILNFFNNRATNASAESFNAKIKAFRNAMRGVRDVELFLFRLSKIYA